MLIKLRKGVRMQQTAMPVKRLTTFKTHAEIGEMIRCQDQNGLIAYANGLRAALTDGAGFMVHDGAAEVFFTFIGNAMYGRAFKVTRAFNCRALPICEWHSPKAHINPGDFVRNVNDLGEATRHLVLSTNPSAPYGDSSVTSKQDTFGFSVCVDRPYSGGVGVNGLEQPATRSGFRFV